MTKLTFQVLEGVDRGRVFREVPAPVTIGREEGNLLRLNDERVSRFHAKVQLDSDDIILTDLESTNGTRVNGRVVQIRRLRAAASRGGGPCFSSGPMKRSPPGWPRSPARRGCRRAAPTRPWSPWRRPF